MSIFVIFLFLTSAIALVGSTWMLFSRHYKARETTWVAVASFLLAMTMLIRVADDGRDRLFHFASGYTYGVLAVALMVIVCAGLSKSRPIVD